MVYYWQHLNKERVNSMNTKFDKDAYQKACKDWAEYQVSNLQAVHYDYFLNLYMLIAGQYIDAGFYIIQVDQ